MKKLLRRPGVEKWLARGLLWGLAIAAVIWAWSRR